MGSLASIGWTRSDCGRACAREGPGGGKTPARRAHDPASRSPETGGADGTAGAREHEGPLHGRTGSGTEGRGAAAFRPISNSGRGTSNPDAERYVTCDEQSPRTTPGANSETARSAVSTPAVRVNGPVRVSRLITPDGPAGVACDRTS